MVEGRHSIGPYQFARKLPSESKNMLFVASSRHGGTYVVKIQPRTPKNAQHLQLHSKLYHPNLVNVLDILEWEECYYEVMEYAQFGDLFDYLQKNQFIPESEVRHIFIQLLAAVKYLHSKGIVHRDIKLENLLIFKNRRIKLADMEFCTQAGPGNLISDVMGTDTVMSPELIQLTLLNDKKTLYDGYANDIWCMGMCLYLMLFRKYPFNIHDLGTRLKKYKTEKIPFPEKISPDSHDLLEKMLTHDPLQRITLDEIMSHPWISSHVANYIREPEQIHPLFRCRSI